MDADSSGALLAVRGGSTFIGVERSGKPAWRDTGQAKIGADLKCAFSCPGAVASTSISSINSPLVPDASPVLLGVRRAATFPAAFKIHVLSLDTPEDAVYTTTDAHGNSSLKIGLDRPTSIPIEGFFTVWNIASDRQSAVAVTVADGTGRSYARLFVRRPSGGWAAAGPARPTFGVVGCPGPTRGSMVVADPQLTMFNAAGAETRLGSLQDISSCSSSRDAIAATSSVASPSGVATKAEIYGIDGSVNYTETVDADLSVRGDARSGRFAFVGRGYVRLLDESGVVHLREEASDAVFAADGTLVVAQSDDRVRWVAPPP